MQVEESYNLFGEWWHNINKSKDNAKIKQISFAINSKI